MHNVFTENVNKIALIFNHDKRLQPFHRVKSYIYWAIVGRVCKEQFLRIKKRNKIQKIINFDDVIIRILIIAGKKLNKKNPEKTIALITLIYHQDKEDDLDRNRLVYWSSLLFHSFQLQFQLTTIWFGDNLVSTLSSLFCICFYKPNIFVLPNVFHCFFKDWIFI